MTVLNLTTSVNLSDVHQASGVNDAGKNVTASGAVQDLTLLSPGSHSSGDEYTVAIRFTSATIAQAATINSADFSMRANATYNAGANVIKFHASCQDADNAAALNTSAGDLRASVRARTTADTAWTQTSVTGGTRYTVSITSPVQTVVNRASWASGNAIVVLVDTHADCTLGEWQDYDPFNTATSTDGPKLDIDYTAGAATVTPPRPTIVRQAVKRASSF